MAVRQALYAATGGYAPTGAISLAVYQRPSDPTEKPFNLMGEHFFVVGPERISQSYRFLISAVSTFGGASIVDMGQGVSPLTLSGKIAAYHQGPVRQPRSLKGEVVSATIGAAGVNDKAGYFDFFDLLWLIYDSRQKGSFTARKPELLTLPEAAASGAFQIWANSIALADGALDFEKFCFVFNDYDAQRQLEVVFDQNPLDIEQNSSDPLAWQWTLNLHVVRDLSGGKPSLRNMLPDVQNLVSNAMVNLDALAFTISNTVKSAADVVSLVSQCKTLRSQLTASLRGFKEQNTESLKRVRASLGLAKSAREKTKAAVEKLFTAGIQDLPAYYVSPGVDNSVYATDPLTRDLDKFQTLLALVEVAAINSQNKILSSQTRSIDVPAGASSWENLSLLLFGNLEPVPEIKRLNNAAGKDISEFIGKKIKVPSPFSETINTGVLIQHGANPRPEIVEKEIFGEDIALDDSNLDLIVSSSGDIATDVGIAVLIEHSIDRLSNQQGTVPLHPEWGCAPIPGDMPDDLLGKSQPMKILDNLYQDPGVRTADVTRIEINADSLVSYIKITPVGGAQPFSLNSIRPRFRGGSN